MNILFNIYVRGFGGVLEHGVAQRWYFLITMGKRKVVDHEICRYFVGWDHQSLPAASKTEFTHIISLPQCNTIDTKLAMPSNLTAKWMVSFLWDLPVGWSHSVWIPEKIRVGFDSLLVIILNLCVLLDSLPCLHSFCSTENCMKKYLSNCWYQKGQSHGLEPSSEVVCEDTPNSQESTKITPAASILVKICQFFT